jgi:hypothetical protein
MMSCALVRCALSVNELTVGIMMSLFPVGEKYRLELRVAATVHALSADERCLDWTSARPDVRRSVWQYEGLAHVREREARPWYRAPEPLNRLIHRLPAETERLMMHGDDKLSASLIGHFHGLLGCAVTGNPGVVGADRHHHHIGRLPANRGEARSRRVAGDADAPTMALEHIAIEPAMDVVSHPRAPVLNPERFNGQTSTRGVELPGFGPANFDHLTKPHRCQQIRGRRRSDHRHVAPEPAQRA